MSTGTVNRRNVLNVVESGGITGRSLKHVAKSVAERLGVKKYLPVEELLAQLIAKGEIVYHDFTLSATTEQQRLKLTQVRTTHRKGLRKQTCRGTRVRGYSPRRSADDFSPEDLAAELAAVQARRERVWPEFVFGYKWLLQNRIQKLVVELSKEPKRFQELVDA